jgi:hypothetical protein
LGQKKIKILILYLVQQQCFFCFFLAQQLFSMFFNLFDDMTVRLSFNFSLWQSLIVCWSWWNYINILTVFLSFTLYTYCTIHVSGHRTRNRCLGTWTGVILFLWPESHPSEDQSDVTTLWNIVSYVDCIISIALKLV